MITELFIKQCKQAEEIQEGWKPEEYDIFTYDGTSLFRYPLVKRTKEWMAKHAPIWLPTLEQLIEMAHKTRNKNAHHKAKEYEIIADFIDWMLNSDIDKYKDFNLDFDDTKSCLLIYIMEEFYNKIWTGEKWEAI